MKFFRSGKGFLCAEINGKNIHSKYDPHREAERFIGASVSGNPSVIIILGAGLGYLQEEIIKQFPSTPVLAVFYDDALYENLQFRNSLIKCWRPSSKISLASFFQKNIKEKTLKDLLFMEWNPSALIFKEISLEVNKLLKVVIQQLNGNIKTTAIFGKKWIRNMLCNYLSIDNYCSVEKENVPIVIASSGPSLEKSLPLLIHYRKKYRLWALPSSLKALIEKGLIPDLLVSTDPGYYGSYHLRFLQENIPVAIPLTGSRGVWKKNNPVMILNQSLPFEKDLYTLTSIPGHTIPSNGTVSGSALEIAGKTSSNIYFTGLDLCYFDIKSHISPHSFDTLLNIETGRINPVQNIYYNRAVDAVPDFYKGIRTSKSLDTYKNWFNNHTLHFPVKRINPSPVEIDNMSIGNMEELEIFHDLNVPEIIKYKAEEKIIRKKNISKLLSKWEIDLETGQREDLLYFFDTESYSQGKKNSKALDFIKELREIYG